MQIKILGFIFVLQFFFSWISFAQDSPTDTWVLQYQKSQLKVFRNITQENPTYKVEGNISANFFDVVAVLSDVGRRNEWVRDLKESRLLEGSIENRVVIYEQFNLPWPCSNRDSVVESFIQPNYKNLDVSVRYQESTFASAPPRQGVVRMPTVRGNMYFRHVDPNQSFARFVLSLDVGGLLPKWVVARFVNEAPLATLEGLLNQIDKTKGQYDSFIKLQKQKAAELNNTVLPTSP